MNQAKKISASPMGIRCDICSRDSWKTYSTLLIQCTGCLLVRARQNPTPDELTAFYQSEYFFGGEYVDYVRDRSALEKNFSLRLYYLQKYLPAQSMLIEIGCSYGFFLNLCSQKFAKCIGYDITKEGVEYATTTLGQTAYCDSFLNYSGEPVDAVCMWDVLEHLPNPDAFFKKIATAVKSGGYVALSTGDVGSVVARIRKDKWRLVHPPTHLFYFDKHSVSKLLEKHGFTVVSFTHQTVYRNIDSIFQQLLRTNPKNKIVHWIYALCKRLGWEKHFLGLNLFDIMDVVARKK